MYTIEELNVRLLSELKEIAEEMSLKSYKKLSKEELVYKILDQQAILPEEKLPKKKEPENKKETAAPKPKPRKRENVAKSANKPKEAPSAKKETKPAIGKDDMSADEMLQSFVLELE